MISSKKKFLKKVLKGIAITIIVYLTVSMIATKLIYDSVFQRYNAQNPENILSQTSDMVKNRKNFSYPCGEINLTAYLYSDGNCENGLVVFAPGFKAESVEYEGVVYAFLQEGFDVFIFNPTGHGNSGGEDSVGFPQIINDIESTLDFIHSNNNFGYKDIFLFGHSRGGYGVCCAANGYSDISAVVSVNGVDKSLDAVMSYSTSYVGGIAYSNYPFLSLYESIIFGSELSGSSAVENLSVSKIPSLIVQASEDEQIPADKFSIYSHRSEITSKNVEYLLYDKNGSNGHVSILYDKNRNPNYDIIKIIADFYRENSRNKG